MDQNGAEVPLPAAEFSVLNSLTVGLPHLFITPIRQRVGGGLCSSESVVEPSTVPCLN